MPFQPIVPTWIALNGGTLTSPSGMTDQRTGLPYEAGGLNVGDWIQLTEEEANFLSASAVGTLHSGQYRFVQIDSGATLANIATGTIGLIRNLTGGSYSGPMNYVTTVDQANNYLGLNQPRKVVFLCPVTAGQSLTSGVFAWVQELGDANVLIAATTGGTTVGLAVNATTAGATTAASVTQATIGTTTAVSTAGQLCRVLITEPDFQG